ncbi:hypothetical protein K8354_13995 [Polaribacter litorisediminis]|uniref:hypothetical protein n=1 Tax=Polaribacter litorisediminis TaxID=1908341 RepID=UPI001CBC92EE|nr:hypothetical protein [Polaribacter litorisediminis]UAM97420.1 hypothetical protein K8354_13995 [Polaribacter litorisediminis]
MPELALNTIILIVLILFPGLIVRRFYFIGNFSKQYFKGEWSERIVTSIFWGLITQLISLLLFSYTSWAKVNDSNEVIKTIFNGKIPDNLITDSNSIIFLLTYITFSLILSATLGYLAHKIIRLLGFDIRNSAFRYSNNWHYYFKGEILKTEDFSKYKKLKILFTWVDVIIDTKDGKNKMIQGVLSQYTINNKTGDLEYLYIDEAERWSNNSKSFKPVNSHIFVVPFKNVIDFNIRYNYTLRVNKFLTNIKKLFSSVLTLVVIGIIFIAPWYIAKSHIGVFRIIFSIFLNIFLSGMILAPFIKAKPGTIKKKWGIQEYLFYIIFLIIFIAIIAVLLGYRYNFNNSF